MIDYYYVPISGYAYLGEPRLIALAARFELTVNFLPVNIGEVFTAAEVTAPAAQSPQRIAYRRLDMTRIAERLGLPINPAPAYWPVNPDLACRIIYAAKEQNTDVHAVSLALLRAVYTEQKNIADPEQVRQTLSAAGFDAEKLILTANKPPARDALRATTQKAIEIGIPGSPSYVLNGEIFFGQDRLTDLQWRLER